MLTEISASEIEAVAYEGPDIQLQEETRQQDASMESACTSIDTVVRNTEVHTITIFRYRITKSQKYHSLRYPL